MENKYLRQYVDGHLRELQLKELQILVEIDKICRRHGIDYWLDGGTCLGAVRHAGFIPWDDDIDIAMRREDLDRFKQVAQQELPDGLFFQDEETDPDVRLNMVKVRDLNSYFVEFGDDFHRPYQKGVFVDIFPFIDYPNVSRRFAKRVIKNINKSRAILHVQHYYSLRSFAEFFYFGAKNLLFSAIWKVACLLRPGRENIGNILGHNGYGIYHTKSTLFPLKEIEFEGHKFFAANDAHQYCEDLFRNHMELPPESERQSHAVFFKTDLAE